MTASPERPTAGERHREELVFAHQGLVRAIARGIHKSFPSYIELDDLIAQWTATVESGKLLELLHEAGVPAGRIFRAKDMLEDPHFAAREAIVRIAHRDFGEVPMQNVAPKLSTTPGRVRTAGPELGEHNEEVWGGLLGVETVREFQIITNLFDVTQGRSVGLQVQAISRSGTNTMSGTGYGFFRSDKFNAADPIAGRVLPKG